MDSVSQIQTLPSYSLGLGTPASSRGCSPQNSRFYTAPSSPMQLDEAGRNLNDHELVIGRKTNDDDEFEFKITSHTFTNRCEFQQTCPTSKRNDYEQQKYRLPGRAKSFCNGQFFPLKPPPGLQTSVSSSPRSPNPLLRIPSARPCAWNDDFDPFQFALEKVSEETRARGSFHRRSHSYSAYRTSAAAHWLDGPMDQNKDSHKQATKTSNNESRIFDQGYADAHASPDFNVERRVKPIQHLKPRGPTLAKMTESKESVYSRRVHTDEPWSKPSPMVRTKTKGPWLGRRVKNGDDEPTKSTRIDQSSMQRVVSFLIKYASLKKGSKVRERSWKLRRCIGYAPRSPPFNY